MDTSNAVGRGISSAAQGTAAAAGAVKDAVLGMDDMVANAYYSTLHMMGMATQEDEREVVEEQTEADAQGRLFSFFEQVHPSELQPIRLDALTTTHPDLLLRRLGVIRQEGSRAGRNVYFNARFQEWRFSSDDTPVGENRLVEGEKSVKNRIDKGPPAIIHIVGDPVLEPFRDGNEEVIGTHVETLQSKEKSALRDLERRAAFSENVAFGEPARPEADEQRRYIQQYLQRSIPMAARNTGATLIVDNAQSQLAAYVGHGAAVLSAERVSKAEVKKIQVVGILPWTPSVDVSGSASSPTSATTPRPGVTPVDPLGGGEPRSTTDGTPLDPPREDHPNVPHVLSVETSSEEHLSAAHDDRSQAHPLQRPPVDPSTLPVTHLIVVQRGVTCRRGPVVGFRECTGWEESALPNWDSSHYIQRCKVCGNGLIDHVPTQLAHFALTEYLASEAARLGFKQDLILAIFENNELNAQFNILSPSPGVQAANSVPPLPKAFGEKLQALFLEKTTPTPMEIDMFTSRMVDALAQGMRPGLESASRTWRQPPQRGSSAVCVIVAGGDPQTTKHYLAQCIARRYSIIVLEGSGGYADVLAQIRHKIATAFEKAGTDEMRKFTTAVDSLTAEILTTTDLIRFIPRGTGPEEVMREIEGCLKGDKALSHAWETYALWDQNANSQQIQYKFYFSMILLLNFATTFITVLQTFLVLLWSESNESEPPTFPDKADYRGNVALGFWTTARWSIILLPITVSLLQALLTKWDPGGKWVELQTAAERLLSEIYRYRSGTGLYSDEEVAYQQRMQKKNAVDGRGNGSGTIASAAAGVSTVVSVGGLNDDGEAGGVAGTSDSISYVSREDLLEQRAGDLDRLLREGSVRSLALTSYNGPIPPKHILEKDDGFSWLSPDQFVRVRCDEEAIRFAHSARRLSRAAQSGRYIAYIFGAIGTAVAAVAAYKLGSLQAWVAVTTSLVVTANTVVETSRIEQLQRKRNSVVAALGNISAWWAALGPRADRKENRNLLVDQVETTILDEVDFWAHQLQAALSRKGKRKKERHGSGEGDEGEEDADDEEGDDGEDGGGGDSKAKGTAASSALSHPANRQFEGLTPDVLRTFLEEGTPAVRQQLMELLTKLPPMQAAITSAQEEDRRLVQLREMALEKREKMLEARSSMGECVSVMDKVVFGSIFATLSSEGAALPSEITALFGNVLLRHLFLNSLLGVRDSRSRQSPEAILKAKTLNSQDIFSALPNDPLLNDFRTQMPLRSLLEFALGIISTEMFSAILADADAARKELGLSIQLHPSMLLPRERLLQDVLAELYCLQRTGDIENFTVSAIFRSIENKEIATKWINLRQYYPEDNGEWVLRSLIQAAKKQFAPTDAISHVFHQVAALLAEIDVDEMLLDQRSWGFFVRSLDGLERHGHNVYDLSKEMLLEVFPEQIRASLQFSSQIQLAKCVSQILKGKPSWGIIPAYLLQFRQYLPQEAFDDTFLTTRDSQVRFVAAEEGLTQNEICLFSKAQLLRKLQLSPNFDDSLERGFMLLDTEDLRIMLSILQAKNNNSFPSQVLDAVAMAMSSVDIRPLFNYESAHRFVHQVQSLMSPLTESSDKIFLLQMLSSRELVQACDTLSRPQLVELFDRVRSATMFCWVKLLAFDAALRRVALTWGPNGVYQTISAAWTASDVRRFFWVVETLLPKEIRSKASPQEVASPLVDLSMSPSTGMERDSMSASVLFSRGEDSNLGSSVGPTAGKPFAAAMTHSARNGITTPVFLTIAADQAVIQAFRPMSTSQPVLDDDITDFFLALQEENQDSEIGEALQFILYQGWSSKETEFIMMELSTIAQRRQFVNAIAEFLKPSNSSAVMKEEGFKEVFWAMLSTSDPRSRCFPDEVMNDLRDLAPAIQERTFKDFVVNFHYELRSTCVERLFNELARRCRFFDLRELFGSIEDRAALVATLVLGVKPDARFMIPPRDNSGVAPGATDSAMDGSHPHGTVFPILEDINTDNQPEAKMLTAYHESAFRLLREDANRKMEGARLERKLHRITPRQRGGRDMMGDATHKIDPHAWKLRFMTKFLQCAAPAGLGFIQGLLNHLTGPQLRWLCVETAMLLESTLGGYVFKYLDSLVVDNVAALSTSRLDNDLELSLWDRIQYDLSLKNLRELAARRPIFVRETLNRMDVEKFIERRESDRAASLSKLMTVGSGTPRKIISRFNTEQCREFFSMLLLAMPEEVTSTESVRRRIEYEFRRIVAPPKPTRQNDDDDE
jgi:hypothetical protein